jgi:hypothetical protein
MQHCSTDNSKCNLLLQSEQHKLRPFYAAIAATQQHARQPHVVLQVAVQAITVYISEQL